MLPKAVDGLEVDMQPAAGKSAGESSDSMAGVLLAAMVVGLVCSGGAEYARAVIPPEETQGYTQNAMGYANLVLNFLTGFLATVFAPLIREAVRPGPMQYIIAALGWVAIAFTISTAMALIGVTEGPANIADSVDTTVAATMEAAPAVVTTAAGTAATTAAATAATAVEPLAIDTVNPTKFSAELDPLYDGFKPIGELMEKRAPPRNFVQYRD